MDLLLEGGLAGHMAHLYDNPSLTFAELKDILSKAASGELEGTEKTDGQNLFISYSVAEGKAKAARNKGNIKTGGMDAEQLAAKFAGRGNISETFTNAFEIFELAVESLSPEQQIQIFGPDANIFYNAEIQDPRSANVINYDSKNLNIHRVGHAEFDRETGQIVDKDLTQNAAALENALESMQNAISGEEYNIQMNAVRRLEALSDKKPLRVALTRLEKEISNIGISDNQTVGEYLVARVDFLLEEYANIPDDIRKDVVKRIIGVKGVTLTSILKKMKDRLPETVEAVRAAVNNQKEIMKKAIWPLEDIIHDFSVEVLKGLKSAFVLDHGREVRRLQKIVADAIAKIEASDYPEAHEILKKQLEKLKSIDNVSTTAEGFVFDYNGQTYKFTGNFAPINQILGLFRYGRAGISFDHETIKEQSKKTSEVVAIYPGKFKPPHAGHFDVAVDALEHASKVLVFISGKEHDGITAEESLSIWKMYVAAAKLNGMIVPMISPNSPVRQTYEFVAEEAETNSKVVLILGQKDIEDGRFERVGLLRDDVEVEQHPVPPQAGGVSATQVRTALHSGDKSTFFTGLSDVLSPQQKEQVWSMLTHQQITADELMEMINEMSAMGAGAVAGYPGNGKPRKKGFAQGITPQPKKATKLVSEDDEDDEEEIDVSKLTSADLERIAREVAAEMPARKHGIGISFGKGPKFGTIAHLIPNRQDFKAHAKTFVPPSRKKVKEGAPMFVAAGSMSGKRDDSELSTYEKDEDMKREEFLQEMRLRKAIRKAIQVNEKRKLNEEKKLRSLVRKLIKEAAEDYPHESTGINVLEDLLKKIVPILEDDYKSLTTEEEQRKSFRAHVINATQNALAPSRVTADLEGGGESELPSSPSQGADAPMMEQDENVPPPQASNEKFIDIDNDGIPDSQEQEQDNFSIPGADETGRNVALSSFQKIEKNIIDAYSVLSNPTDRTLFYDYLITNLKLYFDKFEDELRAEVPEPNSDIYQQEKDKLGLDEPAGDMPSADAGLGNDQLDLEV